MNLEEKVKRARDGDNKAFYELIENKREMLYRIAYTYTKDKNNSLEIISETVFKAYMSIKKLKKVEFFNTWLIRIHINCCIDFIKKHKKIIMLNEKLANISNSENDYRDEIIDLKNSMEKLNEKLKSIIILKYFNDLTLTEIAEVLNCPIGTVKTNLHKALKELRLEMKEDNIYD